MEKITENTSLSEQILLLAAVSGELNEGALTMLDSTEKYLANTVSRLKQDKLLRQYKKDELSGFRLTYLGKRMMSEKYPGRYDNCFIKGSDTDRIRLDTAHRQRSHRISEVYALMYQLRVNFDFDTKPTLYSPLAVESQPSQSSQAFYSSREIKAMGYDGIKINNSRMTGLLLGDSDAYFIYNTGKSAMKWESMSEQRAVSLVESKIGISIKPLMIGRDMELAYELLTADGGKKHLYYRIDNNLPCMYYIPYDKNGIFQFKISFLSDKLNQLKNSLICDIKPALDSISLECDGYADERTAVLFACNFDMQRIAYFNSGIKVRKMDGIVFCMDFQADILRRYFGENITLRVIDSKKLADKLGIR